MREKKKDKNIEVDLRVNLRVQEAKKRDIGRNIARIDQETMEKLDIKTGDIIALVGKKESAGIAWPSYPQNSGLGIICIDSRLIKNTGTYIDDTIQIRKVKIHSAQKIVLAPISFKYKSNPRFETFVKRKLNNYPVAIGNSLLISIGISREISFKVINLKPKGICTVKPETILQIREYITEDEETAIDHVKYEDIGGLNEEIMEIREIIELPSKIPSLNTKFKIKLPRGILLYGPPGCGKSLLTKAISNESDVFFISIDGPEIMSKFYGESERKLREKFKKAEDRSPSIIFIDNLDVIAPKRDEKTGDVEKRVVAQLLSLMDGLHSKREVNVIGITNKIELLEPALLSPGRFDRIIEINLPEEKSREEIFRIHTRGIPLEKSVSIQELAESTQNFSGADISGVCKESLIFALRRILPQLELDSEEIDSKLLKQIEITPNDFDQALKKISKNVKLRLKLMENNKTKENNNKKM